MQIKVLPRTFSRKHKKIIRVVAVVLVLAIGVGIFALLRRGKATAETDVADEKERTVTLQKGSLSETVNASGVLQSGSVSSVTTPLTGKVVSVSVKVGDSVKKGDVICTLDTTELDKELIEKRKTLAEINQQLKDDAAKASRQLETARERKSQTLKEQDALVAAATAARDNARAALNAATPAYNTAKSAYELMLSALRPAQDAANAAAAARESAYAVWIAAGGKVTVSDTDPTPPAEYTAFQAAQQADEAAAAKLTAAKTLYEFDRYQAEFTAAKGPFEAQKAAFDTAQAALDAAAFSRQKTMDEVDSGITDLITLAQAAAEKAKKGPDMKELNELNEKKKGAVLRAETDGEVTELKVTVGSVPKDTVATIQSTSQLILAVKIAEYDINRVRVGLPVRITSDALKAPVSGTLARISPTAETGDAGGFSADIQIEAPQGLHIGGKAKAEIIISNKDNVYTLPLDAVSTNIDGKDIIKVKQPDGSVKEQEITTGEKNDYYIEVSGSGLSDGLEVMANADWDGLAQSAAANQDATGGF